VENTDGLGTLHVWETETGAPLFSERVGYDGLAWSPDDQYIVTSRSLVLQVRSTTDWTVLREIAASPGAFAFHSSGLLTVQQRGIGVRQYDLAKGTSTLLLETSHSGMLALNADTGLLAMAGQASDGMIHLYDTKQAHRRVSFFQHHTGSIADIAFSRDGQLLATAGFDGRICVTDLHQRLQRHPNVRHPYTPPWEGAVGGIDADGQRVTLVFGERATRLAVDWSQSRDHETASAEDTEKRMIHSPPPKHHVSYESERLERNGLGKLLLRNLDTKTVEELPWSCTFKIGKAFVFPAARIAVAVTGNPDARGVHDARLQAFDLQARKSIYQEILVGLRIYDLYGVAVDVAPSRKWMAVAAAPGSLRLIDLTTGDAHAFMNFSMHDRITCLSISPDSRYLAIVDNGTSIKIWDTATRALAQDLRMNSRVHCLAFSPDARTLVASTASDLQFWHTETGQQMVKLAMPYQAQTMRFSADGRQFLFASPNRTSADLFRWTLDDPLPASLVAQEK